MILKKTSLQSKNIKKTETNHRFTESLDDYFEQRLGKQRSQEIKAQAELEVKILKRMHAFIQSSVDEYMQTKQVGCNELSKKLHLSSSYVSKLKKGQANLTIGTFAHVMATLGKDPFDN